MNPLTTPCTGYLVCMTSKATRYVPWEFVLTVFL